MNEFLQGFCQHGVGNAAKKTFFFFIEIGFLFRVALFVLENCRKFLLSCFTANFKGIFFVLINFKFIFYQQNIVKNSA